MRGEVSCAACQQPIEGQWLTLTVADTGTGISPEALPHIFEPFFTTREVGEGSGLGLAQVLGIIQQHGGHLTVESQLNQGATFTLYFPPSSFLKPEIPVQSTGFTRAGQGETILLVEDEPTVLRANQAMLHHLGYQVLTAVNGREALALYHQHKERIALVVSDMVMPDMDGSALFEALKAENPAIKMIIMSGYPLEDRGIKLLAQGMVDWFQKPISFDTLAQIISKGLKPQNSPSHPV
jgi:CheY-like chemotaxis protein